MSLRRADRRARFAARRRRARGFTLLELILALGGTALVAAAITAMLVSVSYGTSSTQDVRSLAVKQKTLGGRFAAAVRSSRTVLATGSDYLVLWIADTRENDAPNLSELRRIERTGGNEIWCYSADPSLSDPNDPNGDTEYTLDQDFDAITSALAGGGSFPGELWATGVTAMTIGLDEATAQSAAMVGYQFTVQAEVLEDSGVGVASLRNE
jgi:type II secretory pathway pseudopilin PulG